MKEPEETKLRWCPRCEALNGVPELRHCPTCGAELVTATDEQARRKGQAKTRPFTW